MSESCSDLSLAFLCSNDSLLMTDFLENFKSSFLVILRSWPGLFACAAVGPNANILSSSPFRLLDYLGLGSLGNDNLIRIRDVIVDLCCEFIDVPYASKSFESWEEALLFYSKIRVPSSQNARFFQKQCTFLTSTRAVSNTTLLSPKMRRD